MANLVEWKNKSNRKPLLLYGARQVGKTYLVKEFGKRYFENVIYVNFETNNIVSENLDINRTNIDKNQISTMLEIAINRHFEKEEKLFKQNIKALSLFFIENIADFKGENAFVRTEFEKLNKTAIIKNIDTPSVVEYAKKCGKNIPYLI